MIGTGCMHFILSVAETVQSNYKESKSESTKSISNPEMSICSEATIMSADTFKSNTMPVKIRVAIQLTLFAIGGGLGCVLQELVSPDLSAYFYWMMIIQGVVNLIQMLRQLHSIYSDAKQLKYIEKHSPSTEDSDGVSINKFLQIFSASTSQSIGIAFVCNMTLLTEAVGLDKVQPDSALKGIDPVEWVVLVFCAANFLGRLYTFIVFWVFDIKLTVKNAIIYMNVVKSTMFFLCAISGYYVSSNTITWGTFSTFIFLFSFT